MQRAEVHRRALRSVWQITSTLALVGCVQDAPMPEPDDEMDPSVEADERLTGDGTDAAFVGSDASLADDDAAPSDDASSADLGPDAATTLVADASAPDAPDAPDSPDAGGCPSADTDFEGWAACCQEDHGDAGPPQACLAWGPPVPPTMPRTVVA